MLPTEIKILILLQVPDTQTLKSLVFASPGYHRAYLAVRQDVLEHTLARQYGHLLDQAEALTAVRSKSMYFKNRKDDAIALLDIWRRRDEARALSRQPISPVFHPKDLAEVFQLQSFYRVVDFFLQDFLANAPRPPWMEPGQWNDYLPLTLSLTEKRRLTRALCRLQIMKNIFNAPVVGELAPICDPSADQPYLYYWQGGPDEELDGELVSSKQMAWRLFYGTIPPWEYDEMGSVFGYFRSRIETIAGEISSDLRRLAKATPCEWFWDILPEEERPEGGHIECEDDLDSLRRYFEGLAGLGPEFLCGALRRDRLSRRNIICVNVAANIMEGAFIGISSGGPWDIRFPLINPEDNLNIPQNFNESWSKLLPHHQPSGGWKRAWLLPHCVGNTLENSIDMNRNQVEDWEWCYALWDEIRLKEWKAPLLGEKPVSPSIGP